MNRKLLIGLFVLSLFLNLVFFVFAYVQKAAADESRLEAFEQQTRAEENARKAMEAMKEAERQKQMAIICNSELAKAQK